MDPVSRPHSRMWVRILVVAAVAGVLGFLVNALMHSAGTKIRHHEPPHITQVMLPPPPPPPPPPPKVEPPKEKMVETKAFQEVKPQPQSPPASPLTGVAGPGTNGYGLQAGDGSGTQIGGNGGGNPFAGYAYVVQQSVQQILQHDEATHKGHYRAVVALWVAADGTIQRSQILSTAGSADLDTAIMHALQGQSLPQVPPADLPQPINLRIGAIAPG